MFRYLVFGIPLCRTASTVTKIALTIMTLLVCKVKGRDVVVVDRAKTALMPKLVRLLCVITILPMLELKAL